MLNPKAILKKKFPSIAEKTFPSIADLPYFFPKISPKNVIPLDREWRTLRNVNFKIETGLKQLPRCVNW